MTLDTHMGLSSPQQLFFYLLRFCRETRGLLLARSFRKVQGSPQGFIPCGCPWEKSKQRQPKRILNKRLSHFTQLFWYQKAKGYVKFLHNNTINSTLSSQLLNMDTQDMYSLSVLTVLWHHFVIFRSISMQMITLFTVSLTLHHRPLWICNLLSICKRY